MEVCNPKGGRTATPAFLEMLLLMMSIMLLNTYGCAASVLAKSNTSFRCSDGHLDECRLIEEDFEFELGFLMNPYVSRILAGDGGGTSGTPNPGKAAAKPCGPDDPQYCYKKVKPNPKISPCKGTYTRGCQPP
ncbi:hypothetical protein CIPAW_03G121600 [Carya illinoinensis]|uniref:Rapid ALkalinization Factor n=1 Tax=Carya illinoinensis TaxID=32201 RepID=A0A8T1QZX8_CARIL|nr:hypothetical protein CIPAW_03G121600 [Carya illinoinensis]